MILYFKFSNLPHLYLQIFKSALFSIIQMLEIMLILVLCTKFGIGLRKIVGGCWEIFSTSFSKINISWIDNTYLSVMYLGAILFSVWFCVFLCNLQFYVYRFLTGCSGSLIIRWGNKMAHNIDYKIEGFCKSLM